MKISDILIEATPQGTISHTRDEVINPLSKEARTKAKQASRNIAGKAAGELHAMTGDPLGYGPRNKGTALDQSVAQTKQSAANVGLSASKDVINKKELAGAVSGFQGSLNKSIRDFSDEGERQIPGFKKATDRFIQGGRAQATKGAEDIKNLLVGKPKANPSTQDLQSK